MGRVLGKILVLLGENACFGGGCDCFLDGEMPVFEAKMSIILPKNMYNPAGSVF